MMTDKEKKAAKARRYYAAHKEKVNARQKVYHAKNRDRDAARSKKWREDNPEKTAEYIKRKTPEYRRAVKLRSEYGLSLEQHKNMFILQGSCCAACGTDDPGDSRGWHTDHCHITGKVRGILCRGCNHALGHVNDNAQTLYKLMVYLQKHDPQMQLDNSWPIQVGPVITHYVTQPKGELA